MQPIADLDFGRYQRRGYAEAVFTEGKTVDQCAEIARLWRLKSEGVGVAELGHVLFTRADRARAEAVLSQLPGAQYYPEAQLVAWPGAVPEPVGGRVVVACAGTSDLPVAREAALTARYLGRDVIELVDVGVANLDRILKHRRLLEEAAAVVVVAGMEGALASVVAGLVRAPVIGVPTSVGYGASFGGVAALLSMLNACAPGVSVVNIDNGYGAGHLAAQISAPARKEPTHD
ncbi:nickel pincer cofactor biosynthesis protein LarB [Actinomyces sp. F1_1611]